VELRRPAGGLERDWEGRRRALGVRGMVLLRPREVSEGRCRTGMVEARASARSSSAPGACLCSCGWDVEGASLRPVVVVMLMVLLLLVMCCSERRVGDGHSSLSGSSDDGSLLGESEELAPVDPSLWLSFHSSYSSCGMREDLRAAVHEQVQVFARIEFTCVSAVQTSLCVCVCMCVDRWAGLWAPHLSQKSSSSNRELIESSTVRSSATMLSGCRGCIASNSAHIHATHTPQA
jgi:hypothetical protein